MDRIVEQTLIKKGWSPDKKYRIRTDDGQIYLLRVSPPERLERVKAQFSRMEAVAALGIPMCQPLEWGVYQGQPYTILSWVEGIDAETGLSGCTAQQQYRYGLDAGRILKQIHSLPAPPELEPWAPHYQKKIDQKIALYEACGLQYEDGDVFLRHIEGTRHLLTNRPQCYHHGDYHSGNMMIDKNGVLTIIDFDRDDYGDPWHEFDRIIWSAKLAPAFASGLVDGYFDGAVPMDFWQLLALYLCNNIVGSLPWAIPFGETEIQIMRDNAVLLLAWYDHFRTVIPSWYQK